MRIIAGEFRGRRLISPKDKKIRPTTDRVRESIFSVLAGCLPQARVLDLFAGTGALGLEALSRGAARVVFVEENRQAVRLIQQNIVLCGAGERSEVIAGPVHKVMRRLAARISAAERFDLAFMDPPYGKDEVVKVLLQIGCVMRPTGLVIAEHHVKDILPSGLEEWHRTAERTYGDTRISFFEKARC